MKRIICMMLVFSSISVFSQKEIKVVSFRQSASDISARTNQREDPKGEVCALVKVQLPQRNVLFDGDIIGEIAYKTNEYWVYMPQKSTQLVIKLQDCSPLKVNFPNYDITSLESKGTYELCIIKETADSPQLYNEGMTALAKNDIVTAFEKLEKASDAGYAPAAYELGVASLVTYDRHHDDDPNSTESYQEAYNYYKKAAEGGSPEGQYALGALLLDYQNQFPENLSKIKIDPSLLEKTKVWDLFRTAADKGNVEAQYRMLSDDKWCETNADRGNAIAQFGMGLRCDPTFSTFDYPMLDFLEITPTENYDEAFKWYNKAADKGLDLAQWRLGDLYAQGLGVTKDINKAIAWRGKAAEQGYYLFQYMMGVMFTYGEFGNYEIYSMYNTELWQSPWESFPQDIDKASFWLKNFNHKELCKSELDNIINSNGLYSSTLDILSESLKRKGNYEDAIYWYQREAEMGYRDAFCKLGEMYFEGKGIIKDYQKARALFEKAILDDEHYGDGYSGSLRYRANAYLGVIYRDGLGVEPNLMKAKTFLAESADKKDAKGMYELALIFEKEGKSELASKLFNELKGGWGYNDNDDYYKNKAQAPAEEIVFDAEEEATASISALTEKIEAQDASKFQEVLAAVQEKTKEIIGSNPEVAKEYVTKVQDFLKENAEKIKAFAGENVAVQVALAAFTGTPADAVVNGLMQTKEH